MVQVLFRLQYEEMLERKNGQYEHNLNIQPGAGAEVAVEVNIRESLSLSHLTVPDIRQNNEIFQDKSNLKDNPNANVSSSFLYLTSYAHAPVLLY